MNLWIGVHFGLGLLTVVAGCGPQTECSEDCDGSSGASSDSSADASASSSGASTSGAALTCEQATETARVFLAQNAACETVLDCVFADGICYHGDFAGPCGGVGLSATADLDTWQGLHDALEDTCECGASACGSTMMCSDAGRCTPSFGDAEYCPSIRRDVDSFLWQNRSCETADDCVLVKSSCYVDDCAAVTLSADADQEAWQHLDSLLGECDAGDGTFCNYIGECAVTELLCDAGQCVASR